MGYTKTVWNEKSVPGISGAKLNKIEQGIYEAHERIANMQEIPSGGTSADAALYDINIGFDGTNHGAPGDSVRAQAQQLDDKINEVSGQLSSEIANVDRKIIVGKNKYNKAEKVDGYYYYNGSKRQNNSTCYVKSYNLEAGQEYILSIGTSTVWLQFQSADDSGYISSINIGNGTTFTVPEGAKVTYISCYIDTEESLQIEKGNVVTSYEEYGYMFSASPYITKNDIEKPVFVVEGNKTLKDVISEALQYDNSKVIIKKNIDIIEELGADFIKDFTYGGTVYSDGYYLGKGIEITALPNVAIRCNYAGDNADFKERYSIFAVHKGYEDNSFYIHDVKFIFSNIRYAVHDELYNRTNYGKHRIENCVFSSADNRTAIGTGSGLNNSYEYKNNLFDSGFFWHNSVDGSGICDVIMNGNFFTKGSPIFTYGGSGTITSRIIVSNNKFVGDLVQEPTSGYSENNGMQLYHFNNVIG